MFLCKKKRFASSANIMSSNILNTLQKSFRCILNRGNPKMDPWDTTEIISKLDGLIGPISINCFLFER